MGIATDSLSSGNVMFLGAQMAADSSASQLSAVVAKGFFLSGYSRPVVKCAAPGINSNIWIMRCRPLLPSAGDPPSAAVVLGLLCSIGKSVKCSPFVVWQHRVFCLCNGSRGGPSIKKAAQRPVCQLRRVFIFFVDVICCPVPEYVLYLDFYHFEAESFGWT